MYHCSLLEWTNPEYFSGRKIIPNKLKKKNTFVDLPHISRLRNCKTIFTI